MLETNDDDFLGLYDGYNAVWFIIFLDYDNTKQVVYKNLLTWIASNATLRFSSIIIQGFNTASYFGLNGVSAFSTFPISAFDMLMIKYI